VEYPVLLVTGNREDRARMALAFVMAAPNVRLCIANDGEQARTYLSGFERYADRDAYPIPQLILLDLDLPRNSGLEILRPGVPARGEFVHPRERRRRRHVRRRQGNRRLRSASQERDLRGIQ